MAYPTGSDVATLLIHAGVITSAPADLTLYNSLAASAALQFERDTGWIPFEASASDASYYYDPPHPDKGSLDLGRGFASVTSVTVDGETLTLGTQVHLWPYNASPKRMLVWDRTAAANMGIEDKGVVVVGKAGYCASGSIPEDAKRAIVALASSQAMEIAAGSSGVPNEVREGDVSYKAGDDGTLATKWVDWYKDAVQRYRRVAL